MSRSPGAPSREMHFEPRMSDAEALMWTIEQDPWLNPSGSMVTICDAPIDFERFRRRIRDAVAHIPRLRERVVPGIGRLSPPVWAVDPEFDFDYHLRRLSLPPPGTTRDLFDLVTRLYEDPFDRTRPLWLFVVIDGLEGGRGALFWKTHHSISDGNGLVRLAERYLETARDAPLTPEVDLDALVADAHRGSGRIGLTVARAIADVLRRPAGVARRVLGEVALWPADPWRARDSAVSVAGDVRTTLDQLRGGGDVAGGSPLWKARSRRRHLESLRVDLADAKAAGKTLGGSVNDFFVAGAVIGALAFHAERGADVDALNISFVVSTRTDDRAGANAFTPTRVQVPGGAMPVEERLHAVRDRMAAKRAAVHGAGPLSDLAPIANLLPASVITRLTRALAGKMDFATSNLRAAPFPMYISGALVLENVIMGPVAGTAFNLTAVSYNGSLDMGLFVDPAAVDDPPALRRCLVAAYDSLVEAGGIVAFGHSDERPRRERR